MKRLIMALTFTVGLWPLSAQAAPIFFDSFDAENGGVGQLNYNGFSNFAVSNGAVDLIGNNFWDFLPGNGLYVDLDGSETDAGVVTAKPLNLGAGLYELSFDLGGSHRGTTEDVSVTIFGANNPNYGSLGITKLDLDPFAPVVLQFTLFAPDAIRFSFSNSGNDNIGALLDDVQLDQLQTVHAPEPGSMILLGSGMVLVARRLRRQRTTTN